MKRIILGLLFLFTVSVTFGQNKWQQKQINYFVEEATKEYNLNEDQVKELHEARVEMVTAYSDTQKQSKDGTLSDEDRKEKGKEIAQNFQKTLTKITGKSYKEFSPFLQRMREELKALK
jgi:molecular chaperone DnaK (HSP70)